MQTYDRAIAKIPPAILLAANRGGAFHPPIKIILPDSLFGRSDWKYTVRQPEDDWNTIDYDASRWRTGVGGFGTPGTPGIYLNTTWSTADIWLRRQFTLAPDDLSRLQLQVFHDEDVEIYLNGVLALKLPGFLTDYDDFDLPNEIKAVLHPGENTIAVHCHQTIGGQGVDVGILVPFPADREKK